MVPSVALHCVLFQYFLPSTALHAPCRTGADSQEDALRWQTLVELAPKHRPWRPERMLGLTDHQLAAIGIAQTAENSTATASHVHVFTVRWQDVETRDANSMAVSGQVTAWTKLALIGDLIGAMSRAHERTAERRETSRIGESAAQPDQELQPVVAEGCASGQQIRLLLIEDGTQEGHRSQRRRQPPRRFPTAAASSPI